MHSALGAHFTHKVHFALQAHFALALDLARALHTENLARRLHGAQAGTDFARAFGMALATLA